MIDLGRVRPGVDEECAVAECSGIGVCELEPAGVGGDGDEEGVGDFFGYLPAGVFEKIANDQARGRRRCVDELDVAEPVGAEVVVDDENGFVVTLQILAELRQLAVAVRIDNYHEVG